MKTIILAGGFGSRISISDNDRPKPLVRIGNKPIKWDYFEDQERKLKIYPHLAPNVRQ